MIDVSRSLVLATNYDAKTPRGDVRTTEPLKQSGLINTSRSDKSKTMLKPNLHGVKKNMN
jgi:hypothetical protein